MTRYYGREVRTALRRDPLEKKGGKVPVGSNVGTLRPPTGGSKPTPNSGNSGQSTTTQNRNQNH